MSRKALGLLGARGHAGAALLPLLGAHPRFDLQVVCSRALAGRRVAEEVPGLAASPDLRFEDLDPEQAAARGLDAWVLALPNGEAGPFVEQILARRPDAVLVDLSADHRFDPGWRYGLVERNRAALAGSPRIANPGCYATGMQLALAPLLDLLDGAPQVFGVSGYSGAGTAPSPRNDVERLRDNLMPYGLLGHLHEREASHHLGRPVRFMPHVGPFFRGISLTLSLDLRTPASADELHQRLAAAYAGEPLLQVVREVPLLRDNAGRHHVAIGGCAAQGRRAVLVATLDNLLKGAATQAVQNLNLACGYQELAGIR